MRFVHQFTVDAPIDVVAEFHAQPESMAKITPPPIRVEMHHAPERLTSDSNLSFSLRIGPLSIPWQVHIPYAGPTGFVDSQVSGLFGRWEHRHIFIPSSANSTAVVDIVEAQLSTSVAKRVVGTLMWMGMPILFRYRAWMTQHILSQQEGGPKFAEVPPASHA